jgi:hypothetical protein
MTQHKVEVTATAGATASVDAKVKRGSDSWAYIYIFLGFVLSIEGTAIGMIDPVWWLYRLLGFGVLLVVTCWLFLFNGWFQNKLIGLKCLYESKAR